MARRYRMTPRRRAALRKAQLASARKRRRRQIGQVAKSVGSIAGGIAASAAIYHANKYAQKPALAVQHGKALHGFVKRKMGSGPDPNAPGVGTVVRRVRPIGYYPSNKTARMVAGRRISGRQRSRLR